MQNNHDLMIRDIVAQKYGFDIPPSIEGPPLLMDEKLTVRGLIQAQKEIYEQNMQIGVNLETSLLVLTTTKKISLFSVFLCNYSWLIFLILSIGLFFANKIYSILSFIITIKEFFFPFMKGRMYRKIRKLVLSDYEALYMLVCAGGVSIKE